MILELSSGHWDKLSRIYSKKNPNMYNKTYLFKIANITKEEKFTLDSELRKPQGQEQN